jgi:hypothetical protein
VCEWLPRTITVLITEKVLRNSRSVTASQTQGETPAVQEVLDFDFDLPMGLWRADELPQTSSHSGGSSLEMIGPPTSVSDGHMSLGVKAKKKSGSPEGAESPANTSQPSSIDERIEWILECALDTGFENFDELVTAYYNATFESPTLSNEQRLSRNRRLPTVIADIFEAADQWSDWEKRGFYEELLKATESMLISETAQAHGLINASIRPLLAAQNQNTSPSVRSILAIRKTIINEVRKIRNGYNRIITDFLTAA